MPDTNLQLSGSGAKRGTQSQTGGDDSRAVRWDY